ncbi:MAG: amino acid permease [Spirochaetia bacterium]|nr:amino acid permease [Spirochaetia bacterium]
MKLKRDVSLAGVFALAVGAMISSGIFILPSLAFAQSGPSAIVSYGLAGILAMLGSLSMIELATAMPRSGGDYYFINRSLGPFVGTFSGILGWLALSLKSALAVYGIGEVLWMLWGINPLISSTICIVFFVVVNLSGAKEAARLQSLLVAFLLLLLVVFIVASLGKVNPANYKPFFKGTPTDMLVTSGFVFISFGGLLKVANLAEEIKDPKKNIPRGMLSSIIVVTVLYVLVMVGVTGLLDPEEFAVAPAPVAQAASVSLGSIGFILMNIASSLAFLTTANAGILAASRYPLSLSRDGLLPSFFVRLNKRGMPYVAIIITGLLMWISLLLDLNSLVKAASSVILTSYVLTNISVIVLRESRLEYYQPSFKSPFYPWLHIACILLFTFFVFELGSLTLEVALLLGLGCLLLYLFYGSKHSSGEYALLHVLKRIADERLTQGLLEKELEEIVVERDSREKYFYELVARSKVYEIQESCSFPQLLEQVIDGDMLPFSCNDKQHLMDEFLHREEEASTQLSSFLAVPHVILDDLDQMEMVALRCKEGVSFSDDEPPVKAVFLLFGPLEARQDHLIALTHIARAASNEDFPSIWLSTDLSDLLDKIFPA